ncbi:hypothetical protein HK099_007535 [Clydaea vesicula]|uniref:Glycosyltransferase n=1 Tax=Clydaea vesicula TaxID=447962 RepID=A0AAD5XY19_9FUNG|nr:hypothetical protein HK099_007535 [Clydaea vesicula]
MFEVIDKANAKKVLLLVPPTYGHVYPMIELGNYLIQLGLKVTIGVSSCYIPLLKEKAGSLLDQFLLLGFQDTYTVEVGFNDDTINELCDSVENFFYHSENFFDLVIVESFLSATISTTKKFTKILCLLVTTSGQRFIKLKSNQSYPDFIKKVKFHLIDELENKKNLNYVLISSFEGLEKNFFETYKSQLDCYNCPFKFIGPLGAYSRQMQNVKPSNNLQPPYTQLGQYLDSKKDKSVIYISFGSCGYISEKQVREIALALLEFKCCFVWSCKTELLSNLTEEIRISLNNLGLCLEWAPQVTAHSQSLTPKKLFILSHKAIAFYLTHTGWNSTCEALEKGIPMLCWPLEADQHENADLLVNLKVAHLIPGTRDASTMKGPDGEGDGRLVPHEELAAKFKYMFDELEVYSAEARKYIKLSQEAASNGKEFLLSVVIN